MACDTGDGKTLRPPNETVPPPTTVVPTTVVLGGALDRPAPTGQAVASDDVPALPATEFRLAAPWIDGAAIDPRYTCDGVDVAPALSWASPPAGTAELAVAMVDESISNGPPFVHWVIAGIDPTASFLVEGEVPVGAVQALNFFGDIGWNGPCPPVGDAPHVYRFTVYALNQQAELADGTPATDLLGFVESVAVASADVTGTYRR